MEKIPSYNAAAPLAYYEVGTVYSFYGRTYDEIRADGPASEMQIKAYAPSLLALDGVEPDAKSKSDEGERAAFSADLIRFYAVVVDKINDAAPVIEVMFLNGAGYGLRRYSVGKPCTTDGLELMVPGLLVPAATLSSAGKKVKHEVPKEIIAGITRDVGTGEIISGITHSGKKVVTDSRVVSGVTHSPREEIVSGITHSKA